MFDITPHEIAALDDTQIRELIGRLCECELHKNRHSPLAVTYGGDQDAPDGGLDVRVSLPPETIPLGCLPRASTGFQVKAADMSPARIASEMAPGGVLRSAIAELANENGAYILVASRGSTSDAALQRRIQAMTRVISSLPNATALVVDFYDRTRLASWVRHHPSTILWVRRVIGRPIQGWEPYGA